MHLFQTNAKPGTHQRYVPVIQNKGQKEVLNMNNNFNIVKIDSKGRILIPFHIRNYADLNENSEVMLMSNGNKEIKVIPIVEGENATINILMKDEQGSLGKTIDTLSKHNIDILMSHSKTIEKGKLAEWTAMLDISNCKDIKKFEHDISKLDVIKKSEVVVR